MRCVNLSQKLRQVGWIQGRDKSTRIKGRDELIRTEGQVFLAHVKSRAKGLVE